MSVWTELPRQGWQVDGSDRFFELSWRLLYFLVGVHAVACRSGHESSLIVTARRDFFGRAVAKLPINSKFWTTWSNLKLAANSIGTRTRVLLYGGRVLVTSSMGWNWKQWAGIPEFPDFRRHLSSMTFTLTWKQASSFEWVEPFSRCQSTSMISAKLVKVASHRQKVVALSFDAYKRQNGFFLRVLHPRPLQQINQDFETKLCTKNYHGSSRWAPGFIWHYLRGRRFQIPVPFQPLY